MSGRKAEGNRFVIALAVFCIIALGGLSAVMYARYSSLYMAYNDYVGSHHQDDFAYNSLLDNYNSLQLNFSNYVRTHPQTDPDYSFLVDNYSSLQSAYNDYVGSHHQDDAAYNALQAAYNSLQSTYNSYVANHHYADSEYNSLQSSYNSLQSANNDLSEIVSLSKSAEWVTHYTLSQPVNSYSYWTFSATYAGYIVVTVESSTTSNTYVEVIYNSHGVNYDSKISVGTAGTPAFPVLPSGNIQVRIGNTNLINGATETVTITYWY